VANRRIYVCSGIFIAVLSGTEEYSEECRSILESAQRNEVQLWTSFVTLTEVTHKRRLVQPRGVNDEQIVNELFVNTPIEYVALEYVIANNARIVIWDHQKQTRDAIHLASSAAANCEIFYTVDRGLLNLNDEPRKRIAFPRISLPEFLTHPGLPLG